MKRVFLILILLFPVATLLFWVLHGDAIRPRKTPNTQVQTNSASTNAPGATNQPPPSNPSEQPAAK